MVPAAGQICQCLKKEPLCSAWCHLPHPLPPYLLQCLRSCLAVNNNKNKKYYNQVCQQLKMV